ncbi:LRR-domain containing protein [Trema orientale]|uniref:LRR-domain containing protein n=1 Tax=Trema orientale TaxID=63057 RepID=A0A2P5FBR4_TREOI|nr:LRR-domain containing protein [Trema orientale]
MKLPNPTSSCASTLSMFFQVMLLFFVSLLMQPASCIIANALGNETDRFALLKFKGSISNDPHGVMSSWNDSIHFCNWPGITCSSRHQRTTTLNLAGYNLRGTISPSIGNLSFLRFISLENNSFFGEIPQSVGLLFRLRHLNLSNNMLEGELPVNLSYCSELRILRLGINRLSGTIPFELGNLGKLVLLSLVSNNISGGIPPSLGNISSLSWFSVTYNHLVGTLPDEFGRLKKLTIFEIGANNLSGMIPLSLYNISSMKILALAFNQFQGTLPPTMGLRLPNVQLFYIGGNKFSGTIPEFFSNASQLQQLDIGENNFFGQVPTSLGNLPHLQGLYFKDNSLGGYSSSGLAFIDSLTNCSRLEILDLSANSFGGVLPNSIANLSTQFTMLYLGANHISGDIPTTLENLVNLVILSLRDNLFTGVIPTSLGKLGNLQHMSFALNALSGQIPSAIGNLTRIYKLFLSHNKLEGRIPPAIAGCQNLQYLNISNNKLSESISKEINNILATYVFIPLTCTSEAYMKHSETFIFFLNRSFKPPDIILQKIFKYAMSGEPSKQGDVYSYGILVLEMFTGRRPTDEVFKDDFNLHNFVKTALPERLYAMGGEPSRQGDVYSYGILVLEMFTGRRPTDEMFKDDFNLHNFVKMALPERLDQVVDPAFLPREDEEEQASTRSEETDDNYEAIEIDVGEGSISLEHRREIRTNLHKCLVSVLEIGLACSLESINKRMNMGDVTRELQHIKTSFK